jgi:TolA-binding protein
MKKSLIVAFAFCILLLVGCSAQPGTPSSPPASQQSAPATHTSAQFDCRVVQAKHTQLEQDIQAANVQLSRAQGNQRAVRQAEQILTRLHWLQTQEQAGLHACDITQ